MLMTKTVKFSASPVFTGAGGVKPDELEVSVNDRYNAIEKIAYQLIRNVKGQDKLEVFNKRPIDNGTTIEQMLIQVAESKAFSNTATDVFAPDFTNKPVVRYFKDWSQKQFATSVSHNDIRKVLAGSTSDNEIAEKIVSALVEGDVHEKFQDAKALFTYGATNDLITKVGDDIDISTEAGYKALLKAIKNTVKGMTYISKSFNKADVNTRSYLEDIRIVAPYDVITDLDVDYLSGVFNLSKAEIANKMIETDSTDKHIYIVDVNAILICTRLYMMTSQLNPKALYQNFWLTVDRMFAISPLFNSAYIAYNRGE